MKKYAVHNHTDSLSYNQTFYTETFEEAKKLYNQMKKDIIKNLHVIEVIEEEENEYYVECRDSLERIYIEEIK